MEKANPRLPAYSLTEAVTKLPYKVLEPVWRQTKWPRGLAKDCTIK